MRHRSLGRVHWNNPGALVGKHEHACSANRGGNLPAAFVCLESERGVSISDLIRTAHTLGRP